MMFFIEPNVLSLSIYCKILVIGCLPRNWVIEIILKCQLLLSMVIILSISLLFRLPCS